GLRRTSLNTGTTIPPVGATGIASALGCGFNPISPSSPLIIDNANNEYWLFLEWAGDFTSSNRVIGMRGYYKLQVSPSPGVATFADVPLSSPLNRFVEALVAAGITAGCDPGPPPTYCPADPVTRGQMAVFLATALGLHFPN